MKNLLRWSTRVAASVCIFFAFANAPEASGKGRQPPKTIYTAIVSVDTTAMTITTETKNSPATTATKTYKFTPKTTITVNGHPGTPADLKPGLQIRVGLGMDAGTAEQLSASNPPADPKPNKPASGFGNDNNRDSFR